MATFYGNQYTDAFVDVPADMIRPGDVSGEVKVMYCDFTVPGSAPSNNDIWYLGKIPKGARVLNVVLAFPDLGTAGVVHVGYLQDSAAVETTDNDAFLASVDVNTAADTVSMIDQANMVGLGKLFSAECTLTLTAATAWTATTGTVKVLMYYRTV